MALRKVLVTGAAGLLGTELVAYLRLKGYDVYGVTSHDLNLLETLDSLTGKLRQIEPEIVINTAAFTAVDQAEREPDLAMAVNKDGVQKLAQACEATGAILAHISTDYVFDGGKGAPYRPGDAPNPINAYGLSKYYGELMVTELLDTYYIIRTSWLYGLHGKNFVQFVLEAARQGREISVVDDQIGSPTWAGSLAVMIENIMTSGAYGTYHGADRGAVSRYEQALAICKGARLSPHHIRPVSSRNFDQPARRPPYTVLDPGELAVPNWETSLQAFMEQYLHHCQVG